MRSITLREMKKWNDYYNYYRGGHFNFERYLLKTYRVGHITLAAAVDEDKMPIRNVFSARYKPKTLRRYAKKCTDSKSTRSYIPLRNIQHEKYDLHTLIQG